MTLLERFDAGQIIGRQISEEEIRRALAIAQTVDAHAAGGSPYAKDMIEWADELLRGEP